MAPSSDHDHDVTTLENALIDLAGAAQVPAKQRSVKITKVIDRVCDRAYEDGLSESHLQQLVDIITLPNHLDQASIRALIRSLYPGQRVSDDVAVKVVASLGHGQLKVSYPAQAELVKWLILVYDVLENPNVLSQLYSVLFNLLDTIAIRAPLCHLLSLITRRRHVRPFRIQMLLELARRVGNEPPLIGLIRVYKDYYPDVIVGEVASSRASVFTHPNLEWKQRLAEIQEFHAQRTHDGLPKLQHGFKVVRRGLNSVKRSKSSVVPEVHTSHAQESSTTLEEIENVKGFVDKLELIELPNQLVAVIGDPLLQKLLQLKSDDLVLRRVDNWLMAFFEDQLAGGSHSESKLLDMLTSIRDYARFTKQLPPACIKYLQSLLVDWNGLSGRDVILDLLSYLPLSPWDELYSSIFQHLEYAVLDDTAESQIALLALYTNLLRQWTVSLLSNPKQLVASAAITALITHTNSLALNLLQVTDTTSSHSAILTFYETTTSLLSHTTLQPYTRITAPPAALIYTLHFSPSLSTLSRACGILAIYKRAFESAVSKPITDSSQHSPTPQTEPYPKDYVNHFNGFLMDICNCLWRARAFNPSDPNALGCLLPARLLPILTTYVAALDTGLALPSLFSLSYSPVLCSLSISYVRELEDKASEQAAEDENEENVIRIRHAGPVTQRSVAQLVKDGGVQLSWASYRLGVLQYLERKGVMGVGELMYNTMKHLMSARDGAGKV